MESQKDESIPKLRTVRTCSIFLMFFSLGFHELGTVGPSLLDLVILFKSDTKTVGTVFILSSASYMVGSIISGIIIDRYNQELIVAVCSFVAGLAVGGSLWIPNVVAFIIMFGVLKGVSGGVIDTAGQSYLNGLWAGSKWHDPLMQALHMVWSLSTTISPLILQPFLADRLPETEGKQQHHMSDGNGYDISNTSQTYPVLAGVGNITNATQENASVITHVQYGFLLLGGLMVLLGFFPLTVFFLAKPTLKALPLSKSATDAKQNGDRGFKIRMLVMVFLFYISYCGTESVFGNLIATFVVKSLRWDKYKGPLITSVFWGVFGVSRIVAIPVSMYCHPRTMMFASLLTALASLLTMVFGSHIHEGIAWTASSVLGFALGPIFPTAVVWIAKYVIVTGPTSAIILIAASIAGASFPSLVAYLFNLGMYEWMLYLTTAFSCSCIIIFIIMHIYGSRHGEIDHSALQSQTVDERMIDIKEKSKANVVAAQDSNEMGHMLQDNISL